MATTTTTTNKPLNPRAQDLSPKGYNRANIFSGKALSFDAVNDYIAIPSSFDSTIVNGAFTFIATINKSNNATDNDRIIDISINANNTLQIITDDASQRFAVLLISGGVTKVNALTYSPIEFGRIVNVAFTFDGSTLAAFYLNSRAVASAGSTSIGYGSAGVSIGRRNDGVGTGWFGGTMAGVKLFNVALTPAQVSDLYLNPEKIVPDGVASSALKLWLPMMEGAGSSAYDGSGNGNDGTINGATWTAGIGAPVAQTALVSWNKGTNLLTYSEQFNQASVWSIENATATANTATAPNGTTTADTIVNNATNAAHRFYQLATPFIGTGLLSFSVRLKYKDHRYVSYGVTDNTAYRAQVVVDLQNGTITQNYTDGGTSFVSSSIEDIGGGWYEVKATINATSAWFINLYGLGLLLNGSTFDSGGYVGTGTGFYAWGATVNFGAAQPYIKTNATAQTSAVLVPEGLTAGASIFGTDIITPRNAFALNLDGASWASVHDNASTDITSAVTLEAWVYWTAIADKGVLGRWYGPDSQRSLMLYANTSTKVSAFYSSSGSTTAGTLSSSQNLVANNWYHVVFTANGTTNTLYINGVSDNSTAYSSGFYVSNKPVEIGIYQNDASKAYGAGIANPRIYNRALTAAEVLRNYNADKAKFGL